jgi:hypothetical protein
MNMRTAGKIEVNDLVESTPPHIFTEIIHSDAQLESLGHNYRTNVNDVALHIKLLSPPDAVAKIEKNIVMGPGKPGSVDKGSLEGRGERLLVSTPGKVTTTRFVWELSF